MAIRFTIILLFLSFLTSESKANDFESHPIPLNDCIPELVAKNSTAIHTSTCEATYQNDPGSCLLTSQQSTVWFEYAADPQAKAVNIDFASTTMSGLIAVEIFAGIPNQNCTGTFVSIPGAPSYCINAGSNKFKVSCIDFKSMHIYVKVGSSIAGCGNFTLSFDEAQNCESAESCFDVTTTLTPINNGPVTCAEACNSNNCSESTDCDEKGASSWFKIHPNINTTNLTLQVSGATFVPVISAYTGASCDALTLINSCVKSSLLTIGLNSSKDVYVKVEAQNGTNLGKFKLCVSSFFAAADCYKSTTQITRPEHPDLKTSGPYCAGETIRFCHNINFNVNGAAPPVGNNCQWIQGIVPVLGEGWDLAYSPISIQGPTGWTWHKDSAVNYNVNNSSYQLYKKLNGELALKYKANTGNLQPGSPLPAGWWFTSNGGAGCTNDGDVDNMWGMPGPGCNTVQNINFCFDLKVKNADQLLDCNNADLSFSIFVFADGETGCWSNSACTLSKPYLFEGSVVCGAEFEVASLDKEICSGSDVLITVAPAQTNTSLKLFPKDNPNVTGETLTPGTYHNIVSFTDHLTNLGHEVETVIYKFLVQHETDSCGFIHEAKVKVYPELKIHVDDLISTSDTCIIIEPLVSGGAGAYQFLWSNGAATETIEVCTKIDTTFTITVIDSLGCNISKMITVNYITPNIEVEAGKPAFIISPNPFDQQFVISTNESTTYNFVLYNTFGQAVMEEKNISVKEKTIKTLHLVRGNYSIRINDKSGKVTHKMIKL